MQTLELFGHYLIEKQVFLSSEIVEAHQAQTDGKQSVILYRIQQPSNESITIAARFFPDISLGMSPHWMKVIEVGQHERCPFFVEESIDGISLAQFSEKHSAGTPFGISIVLAIQLCKSLIALKQRDESLFRSWELHPNHVWLSTLGEVKLSFSGVAPRIDAKLQRRNLTGDYFLPDFEYFTPERLRGLEETEASVVFSVGTILYELLAGRNPFTEESAIRIFTSIMIGAKPLQDVAKVPLSLCELVHKALQTAPQNRYQSLTEFEDALTAELSTSYENQADIGALIRCLSWEPSTNKERVDEYIQRVSSISWLRPDAELEALSPEAASWLEMRFDEHLSLLQPYAQGNELPASKVKVTRSLKEAIRLREQASSTTIPEEIFSYLKARKEEEIRTERLYRRSIEATNAAEKLVERVGSSLVLPSIPQVRIFAAGSVYSYALGITVFGGSVNFSLEPLLQMWERGVWPVCVTTEGLLVYVPVYRGETLCPEPEGTSTEPEPPEEEVMTLVLTRRPLPYPR